MLSFLHNPPRVSQVQNLMWRAILNLILMRFIAGSSGDSDQDSVVSKQRLNFAKSVKAPGIKRMLDPTNSDQAFD